MTTSEPSFSVIVDVTNPGQFFACCGLLELANRLWPGVEGWFAQDESAFNILSSERSASLEGLLKELRSCEIVSLSKEEYKELKEIDAKRRRLRKEGQDLSTQEKDRYQKLGSKSREGTLTIGGSFGILLDWWQTGNDDIIVPKTWAGRQEIHKIARAAQDALAYIPNPEELFDYGCILRKPKEYCIKEADFEKAVEPFYFDARRFAHALDTGFSLDVQDAEAIAYPAVELLSLIGLQRFRPRVPATEEKGSKWTFEYSVWKRPLSVAVASAVASCAVSSGNRYRFQLLFRDDQKRYKAFDFAIPMGGMI